MPNRANNLLTYAFSWEVILWIFCVAFLFIYFLYFLELNSSDSEILQLKNRLIAIFVMLSFVVSATSAIIRSALKNTFDTQREMNAKNKRLSQEIEVRRKAEDHLRFAHKRFITVLDSIDATIYVADMETYEILFLNKYMKESFGRDLTGEICWSAFRNQTEPCPHCKNEQLVDEQGLPTKVCVWQDKNPITKKWYINYDRAIEWIDGRIVKIQIATDITDRKQAEELLKKSEERYRDYFEDNISGAYISNTEGTLLACNKEYVKIFGFDNVQDAMKKPISELFEVPDERVEFLNMLKKKKHVASYESNLKKVNGDRITLLENSSGVFDEEGNLKEIRGFLLDITKQRKLENQLRNVQKLEAIGTLAGGISHDFNNILSSMFGYLQLVEHNLHNPDEAKKYLTRLDNGVQRASKLVRQILTFSRQSEFRKINLRVFNLIKEALSLLHASIPANIVIIENIVSKSTILADPTQIHQVIMNLCTNAYHSMKDSGGSLTIGLHDVEVSKSDSNPELNILPGRYIRLQVRDTGTGIDDETLNKIYDPYFTTKEAGKGTGLGLAVVAGNVKRQNGFIKTYSKINQGSTFNVFWPITGKNEFSTKYNFTQ